MLDQYSGARIPVPADVMERVRTDFPAEAERLVMARFELNTEYDDNVTLSSGIGPGEEVQDDVVLTFVGTGSNPGGDDDDDSVINILEEAFGTDPSDPADGGPSIA